MIIASKGHIRMKGCAVDVLSDFGIIAKAIIDTTEIEPDMLKLIIDMAILIKEGPDNDHRSN